MYVGMGQTEDAPACSTIVVPAGSFGPFNCTGSQSDVQYTTAAGASVPLCISGEIFVNGQCVPISAGITDWLATGHNALYAALGAVAFVLLLSISGRR